jgi:hypothetical protein
MEVSLNTGGCSNVGITYTKLLYNKEEIELQWGMPEV